MSTATKFPRPVADFTFYCYSDRHQALLAPPARTPEEAWERTIAFVRASYTPGHPQCAADGDLKEYFGLDREPTVDEIEAEVQHDLAHYSILLTVHAASEAAAYAFWRQSDSGEPDALESWWRDTTAAPPAAGEA